MNFADHYLARQKGFPPTIDEPPENDLGIVVVIPCFNEPDLIRSLESLWKCSDTACSVEIIVVFNSARNSPHNAISQNRKSLEAFEEWKSNHSKPSRKFFSIWKEDINDRDSGAGLARKMGMDKAISRFNRLDRATGILVSFDADAVCDANYLAEIEKHYRNHPETDGTTLYFEHPTSGNDFPPEVYRGIIQYELYLRYYKEALRYAGFPYAFHTVGSCFTVKAESYARQGGMNKKPAGEDFYFIQKLAPLGHFHEIRSTRVIPSPRPSDRVLFGTGPAIRKFIDSSGEGLPAYSLLSFHHLRKLFDQVNRFYRMGEDEIGRLTTTLPEPVRIFLEKIDFPGRIDEINRNAASVESFRKRFFRWFNAFMVIKYLNYSHERFFEKMPVFKASIELLSELGMTLPADIQPGQLLEIFRGMERGGVTVRL